MVTPPTSDDPADGPEGPITWSEVRPVPQRRASWPRRVVAGIIVVVVAWIVLVAVFVAEADSRLRKGIAAAEQAKSELSVKDLTGNAAGPIIARAEADFRAAHGDVTGIVMAPLRVLPIVGTQLRSVADLSGAAATVASAGAQTLATAHHLLTGDHHTPRQRTAVIGGLATALSSLQQQVNRVDLGPSSGLIGSLASKRDTFATDLAKLQSGLAKASGAASALADLFTGPRSYLVIAANNAEMRAGSGMALQIGVLSAHDGVVSLGHFVPALQLVQTSSRLRATGDLEARWGFENPTYDFRDLFLSPQFAPNAALAAQMWQARTGQRVDGVLLLDVASLQALLQATGPVSLQGTTLDAANALPYLLMQQYVGLANDDPANIARREKLGVLASEIFAKIEDPATPLAQLASALAHAAEGRHLLAWAADPTIEQDWTSAGVGGAVTGDDLLLGLLNQGADKLDPYQKVSARLDVTVFHGVSDVAVTVTDTNTTPTTVRGYAAGGAPGLPPAREYAGAVSLDFPSFAGDASVPGFKQLEAAGPDYGADVLAAPIRVPDHASATVTFHFVVDGTLGSFDVQASARVPATTWQFVAPGAARPQVFTDATAHTVSW